VSLLTSNLSITILSSASASESLENPIQNSLQWVRCCHEFDYHRLSEYDPKKPLQTWASIRDSAFWHLQAFDKFEVSPLRQDLSKSC
jgi:hypothetical protein